MENTRDKNEEDPLEFVRLLTDHQDALRALVYSFLPNHPDVKDLVQEINVVLWSRRSQFRLGTNFGAWASRVARNKPPPDEAAMVEGSRIRVEEGFVELNFASGVRSILRGPGEWTVVERNVLAMRGGTAWFEVPAEEAGFQVHTGTAEITDLGTEFGIVAASASADEEVHVFKGRVGILSHHADETWVLDAGAARRIDATGIMHEIDANPGRFFTSLPDTLPYLHLSFDQLVDGRFEVTGNHPAAAGIEARPMQMAGRPASSRLVEGVRGMALAFDGEADYLLTDWPGIAGDAPRTVVMWVRFPPGARQLWDGAGVVWGTRVDPSEPVCWKFNFRASAANDGDHLKPDAPAVVHAAFGRWWCSGTTNLAGGQWHGLAVTYSGGTDENGLPEVKLYVNGELEPHRTTDDRRSQQHQPIEIDTRIDGPDATPMTLGRTQKRVGAGNPERPHHYFEGEIDEVFIFEGVLGPDEIRRLHRDKRFQPPNAEN